ncbi:MULTISPECIES: efflux RND transporter periplasmic adaptor subunit [unclassified Thioalkalivibrio]|uniref:efflux RND transporter periplasmic adaptor subunit n=1 Tax=unclassified Thioalkalivibrio TaxID=2621013 RepID=UPI000377DCE0|nr:MULTISPECIES: efflux RND transporter periplasmic adaptor subunit [unclassified Thioalkalivibrio]
MADSWWQRLRGQARVLLALGILLLVILWIASGMFGREADEAPRAAEPQPMAVAVTTLEAEPVERLLVLQGRVEPDLRVLVRAETAGQVAEWEVARGARVAADVPLARLRMDDREARRRQAIARLRGAESEFEAAQRLHDQGHVSRTQLEAREAEREAARAELEAIELDIRNTRIIAPVAGVVNQRLAERGDFVARGDPVAEIVDNDPLLAVVHVPQHQIGRVESGQAARIRFLDGRRAEGEVRFVSRVAEAGTQTFRVEVEVPNADEALPSGISAGVEIPTETVAAHKLSPAWMGLDDSGRVGVKTVDDDDRVVFHAVEVIRAATDGVWVTGLPERARVITIGHGFVTPGETVRPRPMEASTGAAAPEPVGEALR